MNRNLKAMFELSIAQAISLLHAGRFAEAESELARAHILGQRHVLPHVRSHCWLLVLEWKRRRFAAVWGQFVRVVLGALGSAVGLVPEGNPGTSDVSMFQRREIPAALREIVRH